MHPRHGTWASLTVTVAAENQTHDIVLSSIILAMGGYTANTYEPLKDFSGNIAPFNIWAVVFIDLMMRSLPLLDGRKLNHNPLIRRAKQVQQHLGAWQSMNVSQT